MLGDLRQKLEPVGRLDVLDAVGARALAYYEGQDKSSLSDEALAQRSKALILMGEIAKDRGDMDGALRRYREALAGTAEALRRHPDDPQRMYDHAQSVFWVGETARFRGQIDEAAAQFWEYRRLADRMIAADPNNPTWQLEGVYASTNLGIIQSEQGRYAEAAATFQTGVAAMERLTAAEPNNPDHVQQISESLAYHASALESAGKLDEAIEQRERQLALLAPRLAQGRPDAQLRQKAMIANMHLSIMRFAQGRTKDALDYAAAAVDMGHKLVALEPANADWQNRSARTELNRAELLLRAGRTVEAKVAAEQGCGKANSLVARDPTVIGWRNTAQACLRLRAELAIGTAEALILARRHLEAARANIGQRAEDRFDLALAHKLLGDILWRGGDQGGARTEWRAALAAWPKGMAETPRRMAERGELLRGTGQKAEGMQIASQLAAMGYRQSLSNRAGI
jgi:tetratricopeptide (TPR) repeat protein